MKIKHEAIYFDMDGVLCDWVEMFNCVAKVDLEEFNAMSKAEKFKMKEELFGYEFFREMKGIKKGLNMIKEFMISHENVFILSAVGDSSHVDAIAKAKIEWIREYVCPKIEIMFVDKVENKHRMKKEGFDCHILVDDRERAIDAWIENTISDSRKNNK
jgi:phosphoglycolate phosphatase-like HAD superfamily hydrolase